MWARPTAASEVSSEAELVPGLVTVGVTDPFQSQTERIMFFTPRRVSRRIEQADPIAILESGKWLGTIPSPVEGEIVTFNPLLAKTPVLLNNDPYGQGWVALIHADEADLGRQGLVTGTAGVDFYRGILQVAGITCSGRQTAF